MELESHFLGHKAIPQDVAFRLYLGLRRGGIRTREAAVTESVERGWDLAGIFFAAGIAKCREIIGDELVIHTFGLVPHLPETVLALDEESTSALFRKTMTG